MKLDLKLNLDITVNVDDESIERLSVDGYDIALLLASLFGDGLKQVFHPDAADARIEEGGINPQELERGLGHCTPISVNRWKIDR